MKIALLSKIPRSTATIAGLVVIGAGIGFGLGAGFGGAGKTAGAAKPAHPVPVSLAPALADEGSTLTWVADLPPTSAWRLTREDGSPRLLISAGSKFAWVAYPISATSLDLEGNPGADHIVPSHPQSSFPSPSSPSPASSSPSSPPPSSSLQAGASFGGQVGGPFTGPASGPSTGPASGGAFAGVAENSSGGDRPSPAVASPALAPTSAPASPSAPSWLSRAEAFPQVDAETGFERTTTRTHWLSYGKNRQAGALWMFADPGCDNCNRSWAVLKAMADRGEIVLNVIPVGLLSVTSRDTVLTIMSLKDPAAEWAKVEDSDQHQIAGILDPAHASQAALHAVYDNGMVLTGSPASGGLGSGSVPTFFFRDKGGRANFVVGDISGNPSVIEGFRNNLAPQKF